MKRFMGRLTKEVMEEDLDINMTRWVLTVSERFGWNVDYIMDMGINQFNQAKNFLIYLAEEEKKEYEKSQSKGKSMTSR